MKKIFFLLLASFAIVVSQAQLANTRWKATVTINGPVNAILNFKKDTVSLYTVADSTVIETMSYTSDGASFTLLKIEGQSDCDNNMPGKYSYRIQNEVLYVKLISDGCDDRWPVIDSTKWTAWKDHVEVKVEEAILKQYAGVYQVDAQHPIVVSYDNGKLYAEGPNNNLSKSPLTAESNTKFFLKVAGVEWDFIMDANGKVIGLISHEAKDYELKKVK